MAYNLGKVGFVYDNLGTHYPKNGKVLIIEPGKTKVAVVLVEDKINYMVDHFSLLLDGLSHAAPVQATAVKQTKLEANTVVKAGNFEVTIKKAYPKRGNFYFTMTAEYKGNSNDMGTMMFPQLAIGSESGKSMKLSLSPRKLHLLQNGERVNMSGDFETTEKSFTIDWGNTFKNYQLYPQSIPSIPINKVGSAVVNPNPITPVNTSCSAVQGTSQGQTKINFYNAEHKCFKMFVNGALLSNDYSTNVTFNNNSGKKYLNFSFKMAK